MSSANKDVNRSHRHRYKYILKYPFITTLRLAIKDNIKAAGIAAYKAIEFNSIVKLTNEANRIAIIITLVEKEFVLLIFVIGFTY